MISKYSGIIIVITITTKPITITTVLIIQQYVLKSF